MKKISLGVMAVLFVNSLCFAQQPPVTTKQSLPVSEVKKTALGTVKLVTLEDASKGVKSEIVITDDLGKEMKFTVVPTSVISDKEGKLVTLDKVTSGEKVSVQYTVTKDGNKEVVAIKIAG